jgi:hypothetical protein
MSQPAIQPTTARQFVEEAMRRLVDERTAIAGSTWQHIVRFFRGFVEKARVVYICEPAVTEMEDEDGTPLLVSVRMTIRVSSHMDDSENDEHDQTCASIIGLMYDSTALKNALTAAMAEDYGDFFIVKYCVPQGEAESRVDGKRQITECRVSVWLPPPESALAWAAQNP